MEQVIDEGVDKWFEKFKDDVDIGRITTFEMFGKKNGNRYFTRCYGKSYL